MKTHSRHSKGDWAWGIFITIFAAYLWGFTVVNYGLPIGPAIIVSVVPLLPDLFFRFLDVFRVIVPDDVPRIRNGRWE